MLVDCQTCPVRDVHCADCMVTALTAIPLFMAGGPPDRAPGPSAATDGLTGPASGTARSDAEPESVPLDRAERRAVSAFVAAGLITTTTANAARAVLDPVVPQSEPASTHRRVTRHAV
jgi:hypothetical protein